MDPISDMLINIKHGGQSGKTEVFVPFSKMKLAVAEVLEKHGFLKAVSKKEKKSRKVLELSLVYKEGGAPKVTDVKRVSKPSKRVYKSVKELRPVRQGYGLLLLSTPKGILTDMEAKKEHVGGEALFFIW